MFYAHIVLAKKGPLARIWLAAHWDKKITKAHVFETNIEQSVEGIMQPKVKLALRTSGHLLLGVVRIYSRKAKYLLADCNEAFVKIKMAFRPGMVDLPEEHREAAVNAITLPEVFHDFDTPLPELNDVDIEAQFSINQSRADEITMREDYGTLPLNINDDGFGDMGFDDGNDLVRDRISENIDDDLFSDTLAAPADIDMDKEPMPGPSRLALDVVDTHHPHMDDDGFGDEGFGPPAAGLFEGDIFADAPPSIAPQPPVPPEAAADSDDDDDDHFDGGAPSPAPSSDMSRGHSPIDTQHLMDNLMTPMADRAASAIPPATPDVRPMDEHQMDISGDDGAVNMEVEQTTLLNNEEESFALAPVDASALKGITKSKRKRKLIVDEVKNISGEEMKSQLANTTDIVTTLDLAPPTKRLMSWKETGGVEKLFALPSRDIPARCLVKNYNRHLTSRSLGVEDFSNLGPADVLALEQHQERPESPVAKRGRKRKHPEMPPPPLPLVPQTAPSFDQSSTIDQLRDAPDMQDQMSMELPAFGNDSMMPPPATPGMSLLSPQHNLAIGMSTPSMLPPPMTPGGLSHGGMTPIGLQHGSMTPMGLQHGGMTPVGLQHGSMTPHDLHHGGLSPVDLHHGGMTPHLDHHGGMTPHLDHHGGMTPHLDHHSSLEQLDAIPNLPADQVSSILNAPGMENFSNIPEDIANDWNNDFDYHPASPGPHEGEEEQQVDETIEQFEERVLNKRAAQMFLQVRARMQNLDSMNLSSMTFRNNKKQASQKFYSLLVLKKFQALEIQQTEPYADIVITRGRMFDNPKL